MLLIREVEVILHRIVVLHGDLGRAAVVPRRSRPVEGLAIFEIRTRDAGRLPAVGQRTQGKGA